MRQLALDVRLADYALFDTYFAGSNATVVQALHEAAQGDGPSVHWVWGAPGSGRSHLLQAVVAEAGGAGRSCAWLPLGQPGDQPDMQPAMLEGMGQLDLLCVDDVDQVAGSAEWERALFRLFEDMRMNQGQLIVTGAQPAAEVGFALRDLASRLASGPTWRLQALSDEDLPYALQARAAWRGIELPDDTVDYLLKRVERSPSNLFALLDRLDGAALEAQRRLTVPFVKSLVDQQSSK